MSPTGNRNTFTLSNQNPNQPKESTRKRYDVHGTTPAQSNRKKGDDSAGPMRRTTSLGTSIREKSGKIVETICRLGSPNSQKGRNQYTEGHSNDGMTDTDDYPIERNNTPTPTSRFPQSNGPTQIEIDDEDEVSTTQSEDEQNDAWDQLQQEYANAQVTPEDLSIAIASINHHTTCIDDAARVAQYTMHNDLKTMMHEMMQGQKAMCAKVEELQQLNQTLAEKVTEIEKKLTLTNSQNEELKKQIENLPKSTNTPAPAQQTNKPNTQNQGSTLDPPNKPSRQTVKSLDQPKAPEKATAAHHPSRLVVRFLPNGIKEEDKYDPKSITLRVNETILRHKATRNDMSAPLVVAAKYTTSNSSIILSTREDQTAEQLLHYFETFKHELTKNHTDYRLEAYSDKKWFKIQVDNVPTTNHFGSICEPTELIAELTKNNPVIQRLKECGQLTMAPRWLRPREELELQTRKRSSFLFATDQEDVAIGIVRRGHLALFGNYCEVRPFQDRPLVTQCNKCWHLGHLAKNCKNGTACRLCGSEEHTEEQHIGNCTKCTALAESEGMAMDDRAETQCSHDLKCTNCYRNGDPRETAQHAANSRDCPIRKNAYGTARNNEKAAIKKGNPYQVVTKKSRKPKKGNTGEGKTPTPANNHSNRFSVLDLDTNNDGVLQLAPANPTQLTGPHDMQT